MIYIIILLVIICGFLIYRLNQKQTINKTELQKYNDEISQATKDWNDILVKKKLAEEETNYEKYKLEECRKDLQAALDVYQDITDNKLNEIDKSMEEQRERRQQELDQTFKEATEKLDLQLAEYKTDCENQIKQYTAEVETAAQNNQIAIANYSSLLREAREKYEGLLEPIKMYEKDKQDKLFYTIQLPEEYYEDIEFLLTTVAEKVQHPDIISKLVWAEYVKNYLADTFKRLDVKEEPGIYKLTSLVNGKSYVGKSTNVKRRIADHFKSVVGITSIADQVVHHAIKKEGFWNWTIEIITYCDKEQLNELEKYYIDFFKTQDYGYNKTAGG